MMDSVRQRSEQRKFCSVVCTDWLQTRVFICACKLPLIITRFALPSIGGDLRHAALPSIGDLRRAALPSIGDLRRAAPRSLGAPTPRRLSSRSHTCTVQINICI